MPMYYRPPISRGDSIASAIGAGLAGAAQSVSAGLDERRRRRLEDAQLARQAKLDAIAEEQRQRQNALQNAELGVVSQQQAMTGDPIQQAVAGRSSPGSMIQVQSPTTVGGRPRINQPQVRPDVVQAGGLYIDPSRSLSYRRSLLEQGAQEAAQQREIDRRAGALRDLGVTPDEAIARAMGVSAVEPITSAEAMGQLRQRGEIEDAIAARADERRFGYQKQLAELANQRALDVARLRNSLTGAKAKNPTDVADAYRDQIYNSILSGVSLQDAMNMAADDRNPNKQAYRSRLDPSQRQQIAKRAYTDAMGARSNVSQWIIRGKQALHNPNADRDQVIDGIVQATGMDRDKVDELLGYN